jgi:hypothetical protein
MVNHVDLFEKALKLAFGFGVEGEITRETRVVAGSAALGVMLDNSQEQLQAIRPHLAAWLPGCGPILMTCKGKATYRKFNNADWSDGGRVHNSSLMRADWNWTSGVTVYLRPASG